MGTLNRFQPPFICCLLVAATSSSSSRHERDSLVTLLVDFLSFYRELFVIFLSLLRLQCLFFFKGNNPLTYSQKRKMIIILQKNKRKKKSNFLNFQNRW